MTDTQHSSPHPDVAAYVLGSLDRQDLESFEQHLATCEVCRREKDELERTARSLRSMPPGVELPTALKSKTIAAIQADKATHSIVPLRRNTPRFTFLAAATAVAAAIGIFIAGVNVGSNDDHTTGVELALTSATGGPEHGLARVSSFHGGSKITLDMQDIKPSPVGMHYEVVVTPPGAEMEDGLSAGTFRMDKAGDLQIVMMTAESMETSMTVHVVLRSDSSNPSARDQQILISRQS